MSELDKKNMTLIGEGFNMETNGDKQEIWVPDEDMLRHMLVFGTTGVGKTRFAENLLEQQIIKGHSIMYFDPKGDQDLFTKVYDTARRVNRLGELSVITPIFPQHSALFDPLSHYHMIDEIVGNIVAGIKEGKDPFFRAVGKEICMAVISAHMILLRAQGLKPRVNIDQVRQSIRMDALKELSSALRTIGTAEAEDVAGSLQDIVNSGADYYNKVCTSLRTVLSDLSFGHIGQIIGKAQTNEFMDKLERDERVIMIVQTGSMLTDEAGLTLGRVVLSSIQKFIGRVYMSNRRRLKHTLSIHIDEIQSLAIAGIEDMFAKVGSANVGLIGYCQALDQLIDTLGEPKAMALAANANSKMYLRCTDADTAEYVVKHFGETTRMQGIYGTDTVSTREVQEDVLKTTDITGLKKQEFYFTSYIGRFRGKTMRSSAAKSEIIFPPTNTIINEMSNNEGENVLSV